MRGNIFYLKSGAMVDAPLRPVSATWCWAAYVSSVVVAAATAMALVPSSDDPASPLWALWAGLAAAVASTAVVWVCSCAADNSSVYDPYWALLPPLLTIWLKSTSTSAHTAAAWAAISSSSSSSSSSAVPSSSSLSELFAASSWHPRQAAVAALVFIWACRFHVFVPWPGWWRGVTEEDWRYDDIRRTLPRLRAPTFTRPSSTGAKTEAKAKAKAKTKKTVASDHDEAAAGGGIEVVYWLFSLSSLHLTPTLLVFFAFAPAAATVLAAPPAALPPLCAVDAAAAAATLGAIAYEAWADETLRRFRSRSLGTSPGGRICLDGPWKWSRHPNCEVTVVTPIYLYPAEPPD